MKDKPVTAVIVGAGSRAMKYAAYAFEHPDQLKIVGVVEPDNFRRERAARLHNLCSENCYTNISELASKTPIADAVINGTLDRDHYATSVPMIEAGYDMLLEKPVATSLEHMMDLVEKVRSNGRKVMICHVLRHAPFYIEIRKRILNGDIGRIINIQTTEHVSYHQFSSAFIRGKWNNRYENSTFLMQKCCHDMDIIAWLKSGIKPVAVSSFGSLMEFKAENAPENAGTRCAKDCPIENDCAFSAKKIHMDMKRWGTYAWRFIEHINDPTDEQKLESLRTDNPLGRCAWKCDINIVDHQSVMIQFEDGSIAAHNLVGGTAKGGRKIHILGSRGEIEGSLEEGVFMLRHPDPGCDHGYKEEKVELDIKMDGHGGGDLRLVEDFIKVVRGGSPSISTTDLNDSIYGHLIGFLADRSMDEGKIIKRS